MKAHATLGASKRRADLLFGLGVLFALVVLAWVVITLQGMSHDLREANAARDQLASQVQHLGGTPVAGPPGSRGEPGKGIVGPSGPRGLTGPAGKPAPTITPAPGPPGASGKPGKDSTVPGPAGASGQPGADSNDPGPAGPAGPGGPPGGVGPPGPAGADGKDGTDGRDGRDGQTCPDGYSLQAPPTDPDALVCRRDSAPLGGGDSSTPQAAGLDPRRQYP